MMPFEWMVSRVCEEFHCLPSQAVREIMDDPQQMALDIIHLRGYAYAKETLENAKSSRDIPRGVNVEQVLEIKAEIMKEDGQDG
jgi:hypothetical protein